MMKKFLLLLLLATSTHALQAQESAPPAGYDSLLAQQLGADDYGMRMYVMAFLKRGPTKIEDKAERARLQKAHMDNITRLAEEGKLVLAGPFGDTGTVRGIYIFDVQTVEEAALLTTTDPAIQAGTLVMELHPWYGSAVLMELPARHKRIQRKGF
jgi:uncharacterized protein YciI